MIGAFKSTYFNKFSQKLINAYLGHGFQNVDDNRSAKTYSQATKKQVIQIEVPVHLQSAQDEDINQEEGEFWPLHLNLCIRYSDTVERYFTLVIIHIGQVRKLYGLYLAL